MMHRSARCSRSAPAQRGAGALDGLEGDAGVPLAEPGHQVGQLPGIEVVVGAHGDAALFHAPQCRRRLAAALCLIDHLPHGAQQGLTLAGGGHTAPAAVQQRKAQLLLQRRHHAADAPEGGVPSRSAAPGQRALLQGAQQRRAFFRIHGRPPFIAVLSTNP